MRARILAGLAVLLCHAILAGPAPAQQIPSTLQPGRSSEEIGPPPQPDAAPGPALPPLREQTAPDAAAGITFELNEILLTGAEALPPESLADLWQPLLGRTVSVAQLFDLVNAITRRYAEAGYALSFAVLPAQDIVDGVVRIQVVEGFVDKVDLTGEPLVALLDGNGYPNRQGALAAKIAAIITASRPLRTADLERALLLLNDLPGVGAQATFAPSADTPGASTVTIAIQRKTMEAQLYFDNRLTEELGRYRLGGSVTLNGLLDGADRWQFDAYQGLQQDSFRYLAASGAYTLAADGLALSGFVSAARDVPIEGILDTIDYLGNENNYGGGLDYPLLRSRQQNLTLGATFTVTNATGQGLSTTLTEDRVRPLELYGRYDFADSWGGVSLVRLSLAQGLPLFDATPQGDPLASRANGSSVFTNLGLVLVRDQALVDRFSLYLAGAGQAALADPLLAVSECDYGGAWIGRGYDAGAILGDSCLEGLLELRYTDALPAGPLGWIGWQAYAFADGGMTWQKGELQPGEARSQGGASVGGGLRLGLLEHLDADLQVAVPLRDSIAEDGSGDPRFFVILTAGF